MIRDRSVSNVGDSGVQYRDYIQHEGCSFILAIAVPVTRAHPVSCPVIPKDSSSAWIRPVLSNRFWRSRMNRALSLSPLFYTFAVGSLCSGSTFFTFTLFHNGCQFFCVQGRVIKEATKRRSQRTPPAIRSLPRCSLL